MFVIKNKVTALRNERSVTQETLAEAVNVSRQTIIALEKGNYTPSLLLALQISQFFSMPIEEIFTLTRNDQKITLIMKTIIEAFRKESHLPYTIVFIQVIYGAASFGLDAYEKAVDTLMGSLQGAMWGIAFLGLILIALFLLLFPIVLIVKAYKFDKKLSKKQRDERELYNDYVVANIGYKIAIFGLVAIVLFGADTSWTVMDPYEIVILVLLAVILGVRMYKRYSIEKETLS